MPEDIASGLASGHADEPPIVVGFDGTPTSWHALWRAATVAEARRCLLQVVHVQEPGPSPASHPTMAGPVAARDPATASHALLDAARRSIEARGLVPAAVELLDEVGDPATRLLHHGARAAQLVVGAGGSAWARAQRLGPVSAACLHRSETPVVLVHERPEGDGEVVVAVDEDPLRSGRAVRWALREAARLGQRLVVAQSGAAPLVSGDGLLEVPRPDDRLDGAAARRDLAVSLRPLVDAIDGPPEVEVHVLDARDPEALLPLAARAACLVVAHASTGSPDEAATLPRSLAHVPCTLVFIPSDVPTRAPVPH